MNAKIGIKQKHLVFNFFRGGEGHAKGGRAQKISFLPHTPKEFFAPEPKQIPAAQKAAGQLFFSRVFDKISSSVVVYILNNKQKSSILMTFAYYCVAIDMGA